MWYNEKNVNKLITDVLKSNELLLDVSTMAQTLYDRLNNAFNKQCRFMFYVTYNFNTKNTVKFDYYGRLGRKGRFVIGDWTVYWAASSLNPNDVKFINADSNNIIKTLESEPVKTKWDRDAENLKTNVWAGPRGIVLWLVVLFKDLPSPASVGNPKEKNVYYKRFNATGYTDNF